MDGSARSTRAERLASPFSCAQFPQTTFIGEAAAFEWTAKRSGEVRYGVRVFTVVTVLTRLLHSSGQWMEDSVSAMLPNGDPQAVGSAITYLRRYALQAVAGIAAEDDDAEATTRGLATTDRAASATPAVTAAVLTEHPSGYLAWFDTLRAAAMVGTPALETAWFRAPIEHRQHMATTAPGAKDELKAIAGRVVVAVGNYGS